MIHKLKKEMLLDFLIILGGCLIVSAGVNTFLVKANLLSGGVTGLSLIIQYLTGIPSGLLILLINIPLFIISYVKLDNRFTMYSAFGVVALSISMTVTRPLSALLSTEDILLLCLYGGIFNGVGMGLVFSRKGSTGGFDIISMIVRRKYPNLEIGTISFSYNLIIISLGMILFGLEVGMYTLVSIYISSHIIDLMQRGMKKRKVAFIVTDKEDEVSNEILSKIHRGVTLLQGKGAYTNERKNVIYCILSPSQIPDLKRTVLSIDKSALINIFDSSEVHGKGFNQSSL